MTTHRYAQANHSYLDKNNPMLPFSYIIYLDANNLYEWAMSQPLPVSCFEWMKDVRHVKVQEVSDDSPTHPISMIHTTIIH